MYLWKPVPADVDGCEDWCDMRRLLHYSYRQTVTPFETCLYQGCACFALACSCVLVAIHKCANVALNMPCLLVLATSLATAPSLVELSIELKHSYAIFFLR